MMVQNIACLINYADAFDNLDVSMGAFGSVELLIDLLTMDDEIDPDTAKSFKQMINMKRNNHIEALQTEVTI